MSAVSAVRVGRVDEASALSALCMRSKAHWGYDAAFLEACRAELTVSHDALADGRVLVADGVDGPAGLIAFGRPEEPPEVTLLFVDPPRMKQGVGRALWTAGLALARIRGWVSIEVAADPGAEPFYRRVGCAPVGDVESGVIPGRRLPLLRFTLDPPPDAPTIGSARSDELAQLPTIEMRAGERFRAVGRPEVAEGPPLDLHTLAAAAAHDGVIVARHRGAVLGFAVVEPLDGALHLEEVSVLPEAGGRGLGGRLLEHVVMRARLQGLPAVTLCTFADVPWNAPWYRRRGFVEVAADALGPALRARAASDAARGLDRTSRVVMRRPSGR